MKMTKTGTSNQRSKISLPPMKKSKFSSDQKRLVYNSSGPLKKASSLLKSDASIQIPTQKKVKIDNIVLKLLNTEKQN